MDSIKIYRIRDRITGLWSKGGSYGGFGKKAKTWDSLGHVHSHITNVIRYHAERYANADIVEFVLEPTEARKFAVSDVIERKKRSVVLQKKYGSYLSDLVLKLEKEDKVEQFPSCLVLMRQDNPEDWDEWIKRLPAMGIKRAEYRRVGTVVAFASKESAMKARLASTMQLQSLDLINVVEDN